MTVESQRFKTRVESREKLVDMTKSDNNVSNVGFTYVDVGSVMSFSTDDLKNKVNHMHTNHHDSRT